MTNPEKTGPLLAITGPTGSGKTELAVILAERLSGEIINADSQSVYKYFNIGTSKPPVSLRRRVPHHLLGFRSPDFQFTAGDFVDRANRAIKKILKKGKVPVICGGTGLYISSLQEGISPFPSDAGVREKVAGMSLSVQLKKLKKTDAKMYDAIDRKNPRRVARALEIYYVTGKAPSAVLREKFIPGRELKVFFLDFPRTDLHARIDRRVEMMMASGLEKEVIRLLSRGISPDSPPFTSIGYREMYEYISGKKRFEETVEFIKNRTHQLAKRQCTWWRKRKCRRISCAGQTSEALADEILNIWYDIRRKKM